MVEMSRNQNVMVRAAVLASGAMLGLTACSTFNAAPTERTVGDIEAEIPMTVRNSTKVFHTQTQSFMGTVSLEGCTVLADVQEPLEGVFHPLDGLNALSNFKETKGEDDSIHDSVSLGGKEFLCNSATLNLPDVIGSEHTAKICAGLGKIKVKQSCVSDIQLNKRKPGVYTIANGIDNFAKRELVKHVLGYKVFTVESVVFDENATAVFTPSDDEAIFSQ